MWCIIMNQFPELNQYQCTDNSHGGANHNHIIIIITIEMINILRRKKIHRKIRVFPKTIKEIVSSCSVQCVICMLLLSAVFSRMGTLVSLIKTWFCLSSNALANKLVIGNLVSNKLCLSLFYFRLVSSLFTVHCTHSVIRSLNALYIFLIRKPNWTSAAHKHPAK